jgi:hypothetical protein
MNPGVRVFEGVLSAKEREALLKELQPLKQQFGISLIEPQHSAIYRCVGGQEQPALRTLPAAS